MDEATAFRCQCRRWPQGQCDGRMTQEDLLCDICRGGCSLITAGGGAASWHVQMTDFKLAGGTFTLR